MLGWKKFHRSEITITKHIILLIILHHFHSPNCHQCYNSTIMWHTIGYLTIQCLQSIFWKGRPPAITAKYSLTVLIMEVKYLHTATLQMQEIFCQQTPQKLSNYKLNLLPIKNCKSTWYPKGSLPFASCREPPIFFNSN